MTIFYGDDKRFLGYFENQKPRAHFGFSSMKTMLNYISSIPSADHNEGFRPERKGWYGSYNMNEALHLAKFGWQDGYNLASKIVSSLSVEHATEKRKHYDLAGGRVNVGRMLAGSPTHMIKKKKAESRKIITLFVENAVSSAVRPDNMIIRAALIGAMIDIMEQRGFSCEIVSVTFQSLKFNSIEHYSQIVTTIKNAGEKLNLNDIVFALGHPSYFRRFAFALVCSSDELRTIWRTQGYPSSAFEENTKEYCVRYLTMFDQRKLNRNLSIIERARQMFPFVKPHNLEMEFAI